MQYTSLHHGAARIWVRCLQAAKGRFHNRVFLVIPGGYAHFPEASNNAIVVTLLPAVKADSPQSVAVARKRTTSKWYKSSGDVLRLVLSTTSHADISASFTQSPRIDRVEFSAKGCRKHRKATHLPVVEATKKRGYQRKSSMGKADAKLGCCMQRCRRRRHVGGRKQS